MIISIIPNGVTSDFVGCSIKHDKGYFTLHARTYKIKSNLGFL